MMGLNETIPQCSILFREIKTTYFTKETAMYFFEKLLGTTDQHLITLALIMYLKFWLTF